MSLQPGLLQARLLNARSGNLVCIKLISSEDKIQVCELCIGQQPGCAAFTLHHSHTSPIRNVCPLLFQELDVDDDYPNVDIQFAAFRGLSVKLGQDLCLQA